MLLLSRRVGETIVIGDDIYVTVMQVSRYTVRLGFTAPANIRIDRPELRAKRIAQIDENKDI